MLRQIKGDHSNATYEGYTNIFIPESYKRAACYTAFDYRPEGEYLIKDSKMMMRQYTKLAKGEFKKLIKGRSMGPVDTTKNANKKMDQDHEVK